MYIILAFLAILLVYIMTSKTREGFTEYPKLSIPEIYECKRCNGKLKKCRYHLAGRTGGLRRQLYNCQNELAVREKGPRPYKPYLEKCLDRLDKEKKEKEHYYKKFRELQDELAYYKVMSSRDKDALETCKKELTFCNRYETLNPQYIGVSQKGYTQPNTVTGLGVSNEYQNTKLMGKY